MFFVFFGIGYLVEVKVQVLKFRSEVVPGLLQSRVLGGGLSKSLLRFLQFGLKFAPEVLGMGMENVGGEGGKRG